EGLAEGRGQEGIRPPRHYGSAQRRAPIHAARARGLPARDHRTLRVLRSSRRRYEAHGANRQGRASHRSGAVTARRVYCLDSSGILDAWVRWYPLKNFPSFWTKLEALVRGGRIHMPDEVRNELKKKGDGLADWLLEREVLVDPIDDDLQLG